MDITIAELIAELPVGDTVTTWWTAADTLPVDVTTNEFFAKTLKAAHDAARKKNVGVTAGNRIDGYPAPTFTAPAIDAATNTTSYLGTFSVRSRIQTDLNIAVAPSA